MVTTAKALMMIRKQMSNLWILDVKMDEKRQLRLPFLLGSHLGRLFCAVQDLVAATLIKVHPRF